MTATATLNGHSGTTVGPVDAVERLLWAVPAKLESLALRQYRAHVPEMATPAKAAVVARLTAGLGGEAGADDALAGSELAAPVAAVLEAAAGTSAAATLMRQGVVLERLGQAIYAVLRDNPAAGEATRKLAADAHAACEEAVASAAAALEKSGGGGDKLFDLFAAHTHGLFSSLDSLGDPVDRAFGDRFGLRFADLLGDFTSELTMGCVDLGMSRRKIVCHLTAAMMGQ
jgi:hypothetical protein